MRVDVVIRRVAVLPLADDIGQRADFVQRRRRLIEEQAVLQVESTAGEHFVSNAIKRLHSHKTVNLRWT